MFVRVTAVAQGALQVGKTPDPSPPGFCVVPAAPSNSGSTPSTSKYLAVPTAGATLPKLKKAYPIWFVIRLPALSWQACELHLVVNPVSVLIISPVPITLTFNPPDPLVPVLFQSRGLPVTGDAQSTAGQDRPSKVQPDGVAMPIPLALITPAAFVRSSSVLKYSLVRVTWNSNVLKVPERGSRTRAVKGFDPKPPPCIRSRVRVAPPVKTRARSGRFTFLNADEPKPSLLVSAMFASTRRACPPALRLTHGWPSVPKVEWAICTLVTGSVPAIA